MPIVADILRDLSAWSLHGVPPEEPMHNAGYDLWGKGVLQHYLQKPQPLSQLNDGVCVSEL